MLKFFRMVISLKNICKTIHNLESRAWTFHCKNHVTYVY